MTIETNGQLCYGIRLRSGQKLPWEQHEDGFDEAYEETYGITERIPFRLINVCTLSNPIYILAIRDTVAIARRGFPVELETSHLDNSYLINDDLLLNFCDDAGIETEGDCGWFLSSFHEV